MSKWIIISHEGCESMEVRSSVVRGEEENESWSERFFYSN